jgi:hypothetical protein
MDNELVTKDGTVNKYHPEFSYKKYKFEVIKNYGDSIGVRIDEGIMTKELFRHSLKDKKTGMSLTNDSSPILHGHLEILKIPLKGFTQHFQIIKTAIDNDDELDKIRKHLLHEAFIQEMEWERSRY